METILLKDRQKIANFLVDNPGESGPEFLASREWLELISAGDGAENILAVESQGEILIMAAIIKKNLGVGFYYLYAPRGPIVKKSLNAEQLEEALGCLFSYIKQVYSGVLFVRIEPAQNLPIWNSSRYLKAADIQPKKTLVLDLSLSEDNLLSQMHQKTRYNIRLAEKKGVSIKEGKKDDFEEFWRLMQLTGERDSFKIHSKNHYEKLLSGNSDFIKLFFAEYEDKKIAAALVSFFGGKATYLHGASDNKFRNIMAPNLLQWEIIKRAKAASCLLYDFYGIDEKKWPGVTRFKLGFGGEEKTYPGVFDVVFRPSFYGLYNLLKRLRKII